jgi:hypothetical protein
MNAQPSGQSTADTIDGDGELPGDTDLVARGGNSVTAEPAIPAIPESPQNESTTMEEK